jgi:DNA-binding SARP family transcriptional activator
MEVQILGPLRIVEDGAELDLGTFKQRVLLAALVTAGGATLSVDRLADEVWGATPPPRAIPALHAYISRLRRSLEPDRPPRSPARVLVTRAPGYALDLRGHELDAAAFELETAEVRRLLGARHFERAYDLAGTALRRWRGEVLADLADEPVARRERPRWDELRRGVVEDRLEAAVALGLYSSAIADLESALDRDPRRERTVGLLLQALYASGRTVDALERYRAYRDELHEELGLDPGPALQELEAGILRQDPRLRPRPPASTGQERSPPGVARDRQVTTPDAAPVAQPLAHGSAGRGFVGRRRELAAADALLTAVAAGECRWLTITGEPGIGKTRLAEELAARAEERGLPVGWGRCHEDADTPPYWPWSQVLRPLLRDASTDPIQALLPSEEAASGTDATARRFILHERIGALLRRDGQPRIVVIDDLQWADTSSLQLLEFLAVQLHHQPLGLVATLRHGADRPPVLQTLATISRQPGATRLELGPLETRELRSLADEVSGETLSEEAAEELQARTSGNAFFATELLRLRASGRSAVDAVPSAIREVIERRLAPLSDDARAVLDLAAVVGMSFHLAVLEVASGMEPDRLFDAIDLAVATGILTEPDAGGTSFCFAHALVRDSLLEELSPLRRQRLHARVAQALEHRPPVETSQQVAALAHHLSRAVGLVGPRAARDAAERAAEAAEAHLAFVEAAGWWQSAARLAEDLPDGAHDAQELGVAAGRALLLGGRVTEGRAELCAAMDRAATQNDATAMATAGIALGSSGGAWYWVEPGEYPADLVGRLEVAVDALGPDDAPLRVVLLDTLALGVYYTDPARSATLVREALASARRLRQPAVLARGLLGAMAGEWGPATGEHHLALSEELLQLPEAVRPPAMEVAARLWRATALLERGEIAAAEAEIDASERVAADSGLRVLRAQVAIARIGGAWLGPDGLASVEAAVERAADLHRHSGLYAEEAVALFNRCFLRLLDGRLSEIATDLPKLYDVGIWRAEVEAMGKLGTGDRAGVIELLTREAPVAPTTWQWLTTKLCRAMLLVECEVSDLAAAVRDELEPYRQQIAVTGMSMTALGPVTLHLGALDHLLGDHTAAEEHLRDALTTCERLGARIWGTLARLHLGELMLETGRRDAGLRTLQQVSHDAGRLGMAVAADRAARAARSPVSSPS